VVEQPAADAVARLEHAHLLALLRQVAGGGEAGDPRADDHHVHAALLALALGRGGAREPERSACRARGSDETSTGDLLAQDEALTRQFEQSSGGAEVGDEARAELLLPAGALVDVAEDGDLRPLRF